MILAITGFMLWYFYFESVVVLDWMTFLEVLWTTNPYKYHLLSSLFRDYNLVALKVFHRILYTRTPPFRAIYKREKKREGKPSAIYHKKRRKNKNLSKYVGLKNSSFTRKLLLFSYLTLSFDKKWTFLKNVGWQHGFLLAN